MLEKQLYLEPKVSCLITKCPARIKESIPFEDKLLQLVKNIKFRKCRNEFQKKLFDDIKRVKLSEKNSKSSRQDIQYV